MSNVYLATIQKDPTILVQHPTVLVHYHPRFEWKVSSQIPSKLIEQHSTLSNKVLIHSSQVIENSHILPSSGTLQWLTACHAHHWSRTEVQVHCWPRHPTQYWCQSLLPFSHVISFSNLDSSSCNNKDLFQATELCSLVHCIKKARTVRQGNNNKTKRKKCSLKRNGYESWQMASEENHRKLVSDSPGNRKRIRQFTNEQRSGTQTRPAIVSGILTGNQLLAIFLPCPMDVHACPW